MNDTTVKMNSLKSLIFLFLFLSQARKAQSRAVVGSPLIAKAYPCWYDVPAQLHVRL